MCMANNMSHRLQPYRGVVNFILAQLYVGVNTWSAKPGDSQYQYRDLGQRSGCPPILIYPKMCALDRREVIAPALTCKYHHS